jgi:hypothetical protein
MDSNYTRIFVGNRIEGQGLTIRLEDIGITAVVKDEGESARKAGFASSLLDEVEVYVHNDELAQAEKVLEA